MKKEFRLRTFLPGLLLTVFCMVLSFPCILVRAEGEKKSYLALGQDLNDEQRKTVLSKLGLTEEDVSAMEVCYITNEMEHQYLDSYIPAENIGTKSISCVLVTEADPGAGIQITTENISYCTVGMYKNALLTSGVQDATVHVAAPTQVSGTAALVGTWLAYEKMTGENLSEDRKDIAVDEIVTIGDLSDASSGEAAVDSTTGETISKEVAEELYSYLKAKVVSEGLTDPEKIKTLLEEAGYKDGFSFTVKVPSVYPVHVDSAQVMVNQLAKAGITMNIEQVDWATWLDSVYTNRDYEATIISLDAATAYPAAYMSRYQSDAGNNFINYKSDAFDTKYKEAITSTDEDAQTGLFMEAQQILSDECCSVFIEDISTVRVWAPAFEGCADSPLYAIDFASVSKVQ